MSCLSSELEGINQEGTYCAYVVCEFAEMGKTGSGSQPADILRNWNETCPKGDRIVGGKRVGDQVCAEPSSQFSGCYHGHVVQTGMDKWPLHG